MALKEQKVIQEITICDLCHMPVNDTGTHIEGSASGYMKRENWVVDLCENCASKVGLKRRGRKPAAAAPAAPKAEDGQPKRKRGRPRKNPVEGEAAPAKKRGPGRPRKQEAEQKEFVAVGAGANDDDGWEA